MREFKFRYVFKHNTTYEIRTIILTINDIEEGNWGEIPDWADDGFVFVSRGLFTGIRDIKGKEIYEGDIVKGKRMACPAPRLRFERLIGQVQYKGTKFIIDGVKQYEWIREDLDGSYEVIGDIYANPELLSGDRQ